MIARSAAFTEAAIALFCAIAQLADATGATAHNGNDVTARRAIVGDADPRLRVANEGAAAGDLFRAGLASDVAFWTGANPLFFNALESAGAYVVTAVSAGFADVAACGSSEVEAPDEKAWPDDDTK